MRFDIIIPVTERNLLTLETVIRHLNKNIEFRDIVLIGKHEMNLENTFTQCRVVNEDSLCDGLSYETIKNLIIKRDIFGGKRAGWYLQQFLKMAYARVCEDEYYLTWDADTILLNPLNMFSEGGRPFFDIKDEYNRPYFTTLNKLFYGDIKKAGTYSFISEHMVFNTYIMKKLLSEIEGNESLNGISFFEKIMNSIRTMDLVFSGFSEFETYGNYVMKRYPDKYEIRKIKSLRAGEKYLGKNPTEKVLEWVSHDYDIISIENRIVGLEKEPQIDGDLMKKMSFAEYIEL